MKRILALLLIASVAQGLLAQPTQYKELNRLPKSSQIRKECEEVDRAWFVKSDRERICDTADQMMALSAKLFKLSIEKTGSGLSAENAISDILNQVDKEAVLAFYEQRDQK